MTARNKGEEVERISRKFEKLVLTCLQIFLEIRPEIDVGVRERIYAYMSPCFNDDPRL